MENKNKDFTGHSRIYLWHRFEQVESDCYLKGLNKSSKQTSLKLLGYILDLGVAAETLTEKDVSDMMDIIKQLSEKMPDLVLDES
jgi:hypothetical protein